MKPFRNLWEALDWLGAHSQGSTSFLMEGYFGMSAWLWTPEHPWTAERYGKHEAPVEFERFMAEWGLKLL